MKVGFIGLGLMGEAMSKNLIKKSGHSIYVYDLNAAAVADLVSAGAMSTASIADMAKICDVIISMVPKSEHVEAVYKELLPVIHQGQILIDMSTIAPETSIALAKKVKQTGAVMLDAPVVKSRPAAIDGSLGIYVGGDVAAYEKVKAILGCMGNNIIHLGDNGRGLVMKLCHNVLVAEIQNGVNEIMATAKHFGIGFDDFATAVSYGGATNFYLTSKLPSLKAENYTAAFSLENMAKDINYFNQLLASQKLTLAGVKATGQVYDYALKQGWGHEDFSATYKAVNQMINK